jgi:glycerophosphoryl diester phosphodiesterase
MLAIGHRGAAGHAPENTLLSFRKAIDLGADWVELDVHVVQNELVVIHDETLERTTSGEGYVAAQDLDVLQQLDAGKGQTIPTLNDVVKLVKHRVGINIELKEAEAITPVANLIEKAVRQGNWSYDQFIVSSVNHEEIRSVKKLNPDILTGALITRDPPPSALFAEELRAYSIHPSMETVNKALVADAHKRGIKVFVFTVNDPVDLFRMEALGVDGVFTDYPERVAQRPL